MTGKGITMEMEYLIGLLHKEWERSGRTEAEIFLKLADKEKRRKRVAAVIQDRQEQAALEELDFRKSMELSKENFILFRLIKKVKDAEDKAAVEKEQLQEICVGLDKEEYSMFCEIETRQEG